ncbi:DedA family protein, partial [Alphaproteobacteria bacterium]|nr:DedA family protein [Alphaproteobacteria bacterium]
VCIGAGLISFNLPLFIAAAMAGRVLRFLAFGVLFWYFGDTAKRLIKKSSGLVTLLLLVVLIGGFVAAGYLL